MRNWNMLNMVAEIGAIILENTLFQNSFICIKNVA